MAKKAIIFRNYKRIKISSKFKGQREELRKVIYDLNLSEDERRIALRKYQSLPRDASRSRQRNRCMICGRPRGFNELTGLCRFHLRALVVLGDIPGMRRASW